MVRWVAFPFATGAVVGPEGTVGACRLPVLMVLVANPFQTGSGAQVHHLETRESRHGLPATIGSRELSEVRNQSATNDAFGGWNARRGVAFQVLEGQFSANGGA